MGDFYLSAGQVEIFFYSSWPNFTCFRRADECKIMAVMFIIVFTIKHVLLLSCCLCFFPTIICFIKTIVGFCHNYFNIITKITYVLEYCQNNVTNTISIFRNLNRIPRPSKRLQYFSAFLHAPKHLFFHICPLSLHWVVFIIIYLSLMLSIFAMYNSFVF